jgi:hypothetical protein
MLIASDAACPARRDVDPTPWAPEAGEVPTPNEAPRDRSKIAARERQPRAAEEIAEEIRARAGVETSASASARESANFFMRAFLLLRNHGATQWRR